MRIAVCEDCMEDTLLLKRFLGGHAVSIYSDACSLLDDIKDKKIQFDLYLLDIFMEDSMSGIDLAEELRKIQEETAICFISSSNEFYREAYDLYAVQYLLKPVGETEVKKLLQKVSKNLAKRREPKLSFQSRGQTGSIPYGKIRYISSREHTISIFGTDGTVWEYKGRLSELAARVCGDIFMRCHQSFIVNMYHVENLSSTGLKIADEWIPVSRRYYAGVKKRYLEILFEEVD